VGVPHIFAQPRSISFGDVLVGEHLARLFVLRNTGIVPLLVSEIQSPPPFTTDFSGSQIISPGAWITVHVTFSPDSERVYEDSLTVLSIAAEGPLYVTVSGRGVPEDIAGQEPSLLPVRFELSQNFPNPFNPATHFEFGLPRDAHVKLALYDLLGREVAVLMDGELSAGYHQVTWDGGGFPSGVYLAVMSGDGFHLTRKVTLLK